MRLLLLASLVFMFVVMVSPAVSLSQPEIIQTGCDTLSIGDPPIRMQFDLFNSSLVPLCELRLIPLDPEAPPPDSCQILECDAPENWLCFFSTLNPGTIWNVANDEGILLPGETAGPFEILVNPSICCYQAVFYQCGIMEPISIQEVCFECDEPVQALSGTWGELKAIYR
jgi:hypothetical protein